MTAVTTFDEARAVAMAWARPDWDDARDGTLWVLDSGQEDEWFYRVVVGAREFLAGGDMTYMRMDEPVILVEKATGNVLAVDFEAAEAGLELMLPTGYGEIQTTAGVARAARVAAGGQ